MIAATAANAEINKRERQTGVQGVAITMETVAFAQTHCDGFAVNQDALSAIIAMMGLTAVEIASLKKLGDHAYDSIDADYREQGSKTWCTQELKSFGPKATVLKGLLNKED